MGGRGAGSAADWRAQLRQMARQDRMPVAIGGSREQQAQVMEYIDSIYQMPTIQTRRVDDTGDAVMVQYTDGTTARASYPSGIQASDAERRGTLKMLLHTKQQRQRNNT